MAAFEYGIPSVIVISTPFQALCALSAIRQLKINQYKFIVHFTKGSNRNEQIRKFLDDNKINYTSFLPNRFSLLYYRIKASLPKKRIYKRLIIGNHNDHGGFYRGACCISDYSDVVYLDDGTLSIALFTDNLVERKSQEILESLKHIAENRCFVLFHNYLTIYGGLSNPKYEIEKLFLNRLPASNIEKCQSGIVFIGTVFSDICRVYGFSSSEMKGKIEELLKEIKNQYPFEKIEYYPHGRESNPEIFESIIKKYGGIIKGCDTMVELSVIKSNNIPTAIFGFTSAALFNLKEIYPCIRVVNVMFEPRIRNGMYDELFVISKYYKKNGIELLK